MSIHQDNLIQIATLKKPYGIKGWLWVFSQTDNHADIFKMSPWYMKTATGFKPLTVSDWRVQGQGLVASFAQVPDRNVAETMNGTTVWVHKDNLGTPDDDEYYWSDLTGLSVINEDDVLLGVIDEMFETPAHAMMSVKPTDDSVDNESRLIPWHSTIVLDVKLHKDDGQDSINLVSFVPFVKVAWGVDY